jgi:hypothetical protein
MQTKYSIIIWMATVKNVENDANISVRINLWQACNDKVGTYGCVLRIVMGYQIGQKLAATSAVLYGQRYLRCRYSSEFNH